MEKVQNKKVVVVRSCLVSYHQQSRSVGAKYSQILFKKAPFRKQCKHFLKFSTKNTYVNEAVDNLITDYFNFRNMFL